MKLLDALKASDCGVAQSDYGYLINENGDIHKYGKQCGSGNRTIEELDQFYQDNGIECKPVNKNK